MMKKKLLVIGLVSAAALLAGCNKAKDAVNEQVNVQATEVESTVAAQVETVEEEVVSEIADAVEEVKEEVKEEIADDGEKEEAGDGEESAVTPAIQSASEEFATLIKGLDDSAYIGFADLNGTTVLLSGKDIFKNENNETNAGSADVYAMKDGMATLCGTLTGGGTAYSVSVKDGALYTGSRMGITKATLGADLALVTSECEEDEFDAATPVTFYTKADLQ